jgi:F0F1-type ATP synthase membrane subunit a
MVAMKVDKTAYWKVASRAVPRVPQRVENLGEMWAVLTAEKKVAKMVGWRAKQLAVSRVALTVAL